VMSAEVYPSMVDAKQSETQGFILVPDDGPYVQQRCAQGTILLSTGGACSGAATSKAGEEAWLPSPWWSGRRYCGRIGKQVRSMLCPNLSVVFYLPPSVRVPCGRGGSSSFYRPRSERITCMPCYLATWGNVECYAVE
jgi:hypothetical protein